MSLQNALRERNLEQVRAIANELPLANLAELIESLEPNEQVLFFRMLKTEMQSDLFAQLSIVAQEQLINSFTGEQIDEIIGDLYTDEIVDLIEEVPMEMQKTILRSISDRSRREKVNKLLRYNEDQTGSIMNVDIVLLRASQTIASALNVIRKARETARITHYFYVVDNNNKLLGYVALEDLIFNSGKKLVKSLARPSGWVYASTNKEMAAKEFAKHDMSVLPVLSVRDEVIGIITSDDVIDVVQEAATEDIHKAAGITRQETPYSKTSVFNLFRSRIFWLLLLMISSTLSQIVLDSFYRIASDQLDKNIVQPGTVVNASITSAIIAILPVISGAAGNAGSQSSTMVIRALATGDITTKSYLRVFRKELGASSLMGVALGVANFIRLIIYYAATGNFSQDYIFLSLAASLSLLLVIILSHIVGGLLPLVAKSFNLDPAVMAAPLLTTLIDALSILIFFGVSIGIMLVVI